MASFNWIIGLLWLAFWIVWVVSARSKKKVLERKKSEPHYWLILLVIVVTVFSQMFNFRPGVLWRGPLASDIGIVLCFVGLAFAVWARFHLGRNWNKEPSIQENHELVTSGPYRFVRHPIYTGIILALVGSAVALGPIWLIIFFVLTFVFVTRIRTEEGFMMRLFPDQYSEYKKRTKALIPFVW
jgi:protein-S-isoprenylcysteine O-methyltransferase Ste14